MIQLLREQLALEGEIEFLVRVHPGAKKTQFKDIMSDGTIKIDIAVAAEDGKANAMLVIFLAESFQVPKTHIEIVSGEGARTKSIRITRL